LLDKFCAGKIWWVFLKWPRKFGVLFQSGLEKFDGNFLWRNLSTKIYLGQNPPVFLYKKMSRTFFILGI
jgi:hypothetical protein